MLQAIYVHELFALARGVVKGCDAVFAEAPVPEENMYLKISPDVHNNISQILLNAANIKKLIETPGVRLSRESRAQHRQRMERCSALRGLLDGVELSTILETKVRNTIEHFDEYLDRASLQIAQNPPAPMAGYNMAISHWAVTNPRLYPLKIYVAEERTFHNLSYSISLDALRNEALAILEKLLASGALGNAEEPGGLMLRLD